MQYGYSKHHSKTGQFKVKFGVLDNAVNNFALPLCHLTVSGNKSDDELYQPIIARSRETFAGIEGYEKGNLYVGDNKFGSIGNRAYVVQGKDFYLMPLSLIQLSKEERIKLINESDLTTYRQVKKEVKGETVLVAEGFELIRKVSYMDGEKLIEWEERRLFVRSVSYAASQAKSLDQRLKRSEEAIDKLSEKGKGKRILGTKKEYRAAIDKVLKDNKVEGLLRVKMIGSKTVRQVRGYKERPAREEVTWNFKVSHEQNVTAIEEQKIPQGWQVYATNVEQEKLSFEKCVWKYRYQSNVESRFNDLRNKIVPLLPVFLQKDNRIRGLVNLLLLALKVCSVIEYKVAKALKEKG